MFTKNNRQFQSIAKTGINNGNENNRTAANFVKILFARGRAFLFITAIALMFLTMSANSAQAQQQNNYWASDGCYYSHNGSQWTRLCPADRTKTKYYYDVVVNRQWQRFLLMDTKLYSANGNTFKSDYSYSLKTYMRSYSNGSQYIYSQRRGEWMTPEDYREYGNLTNAQLENMLKVKKMMSDHNSRMIDIIFAPACRYSYNGCR